MTQMQEIEWLQSYLKPLKGALITGTDVVVEDDGAWPVLYVQTQRGAELKLEISRDEEGNGPGFIFGLPMPESAA